MATFEEQFALAEKAGNAMYHHGHIVSAWYNGKTERLVLKLHTGLNCTIPVHLLQGLRGASATDLADIEVLPDGLSLCWPRLNADFFVPSLLAGVFGNQTWMTTLLADLNGKAQPVTKRTTNRSKVRKNNHSPQRASTSEKEAAGGQMPPPLSHQQRAAEAKKHAVADHKGKAYGKPLTTRQGKL